MTTLASIIAGILLSQAHALNPPDENLYWCYIEPDNPGWICYPQETIRHPANEVPVFIGSARDIPGAMKALGQ